MENIYAMFIQDGSMEQETFFGVTDSFETVMQIIWDRLGTVEIDYGPETEIWIFSNKIVGEQIRVEKTTLMTDIYQHRKEP